jgi:hypothetical protein
MSHTIPPADGPVPPCAATSTLADKIPEISQSVSACETPEQRADSAPRDHSVDLAAESGLEPGPPMADLARSFDNLPSETSLPVSAGQAAWPPGMSESAIFAALREEFRSLHEKLDSVAATTAGGVCGSDRKDEIISDLHKELQTYKSDLRAEFMFPLLKSIILWEGRVTSIHNHHVVGKDEGKDAALLLTSLLSEYGKLALGLRDILEENGIVAHEPQPGDKFEPRLHRILETIPTGETGKELTIAAVKNQGFLDLKTGRFLKQAEVAIFKMQTGDNHQ